RIESFAPASGAQFSLLPPDNATGNFTKIVQRVPVRIAFPGDSQLAGLLRPGLSVTVTVDTREGDGGLASAQARQAETPSKAQCLGPWRHRAGGRASPARADSYAYPRNGRARHRPHPRRRLNRYQTCATGSASSRWWSACLWRSWTSRS